VELIKECNIELTIGRRYGLIGQNGSGKTNFLQCIANREVRGGGGGVRGAGGRGGGGAGVRGCGGGGCGGAGCGGAGVLQGRGARGAGVLQGGAFWAAERPPKAQGRQWKRRRAGSGRRAPRRGALKPPPRRPADRATDRPTDRPNLPPPQVPIPDHLDIFHLHQEAEPSDMSALEAVIDHIRKELANLHKQVGACRTRGAGPHPGRGRRGADPRAALLQRAARLGAAAARGLQPTPTLCPSPAPSTHPPPFTHPFTHPPFTPPPQEETILETVGPEDERLEAIYERIEELDPSTFEVGGGHLRVGVSCGDQQLRSRWGQGTAPQPPDRPLAVACLPSKPDPHPNQPPAARRAPRSCCTASASPAP
jgi:hypothetical protein